MWAKLSKNASNPSPSAKPSKTANIFKDPII